MANMCKDRAMGAHRRPGRCRVAVLVRPGLLPMELGFVHQLFSLARDPAGEPLYEVVTCAVHPGELRTTTDFAVRVEHGPEVLAAADIVFVPAADEDYAPRTEPDPELLAALARIPEHARIASICTGAFVLAGAGLLDGRTATTHWNAAERFRRAFPEVELDPSVLYVDEGPVLTSAGEAAGIDLCLHMIRQEHGATVANDVARSAVVPAHRDGGQAQFIRRAVPEPRSSSTGRARAWALENLHRALPLRELADLESMSVRTFTRRFRDETGLSPVQWLTGQRVERARQLLEETDLPVDQVAADSGFGTAASMRQHLRARLGLSPSTYRSTFQPGRLGDAESA
ncbi:GlxA family transcriptional regulator [Saccharopolyspora sp. NPDC002578]